ncbi:capsular polysaccharide biosynthesis protein CapF [Alkalibacterium indicireducens]|uniref:Capsular polysaccharide biosynthesis protein CapF n=2 Tax=Alkalibacterium indicireducens TaxID=398758 RepID=A0ABN1AKD5_9LACT
MEGGTVMEILITGSEGFVGKNLVAELRNRGYGDLYLYDKENSFEDLKKWTKDCEFVFHLAGINRPETEEEFMEGNADLTSQLTSLLEENNNQAPIMISSSIQAEKDNPYGKSKKAGEDYIFEYGKRNDVPVFVYRFSNLYGKWSKPNYNTVIATFCHNIAHGLPIQVNDPTVEITFQYIDDVVNELIDCLEGNGTQLDKFYHVAEKDTRTLGEVAQLIQDFKESRKTLQVPDMSDSFTKNLYSTYLSFLPEDDFSYKLKMNQDERGSFTEFLRSPDRGQVSINVSKPGITKGQHWHHSKNEKFLVVKGNGVIRFRKVGEEKVIEYSVSGKELEVVDIPTGYTHSIVNTGKEEMVTVMWVNEPFDPDNADTYYLEV